MLPTIEDLAETTLCKDPGGEPETAPTAAPQGLLIELFVKQYKFWKVTTFGVHEVFNKLVVGHVVQDHF